MINNDKKWTDLNLITECFSSLNIHTKYAYLAACWYQQVLSIYACVNYDRTYYIYMYVVQLNFKRVHHGMVPEVYYQGLYYTPLIIIT